MLIKFHKYQGTGNDFIMIDDRQEQFPISQELIAKLCHRRFGIGADGLILLQNADGYDFRMVYFNADGGEGSMCGNGGRCTVQFAYDLGVVQTSTSFIAPDGVHEATVNNGEISLKMIDVATAENDGDAIFVNTGSPHYVAFVTDVDTIDVVAAGRAIRYGDTYQPRGGTNVNFVEILTPTTLKVRTYERGVEDETYSCGTGVTACALANYVKSAVSSPIAIQTKGGNLQIAFSPTETGGFEDIYLIGPAKKVFEGTVEV